MFGLIPSVTGKGDLAKVVLLASSSSLVYTSIHTQPTHALAACVFSLTTSYNNPQSFFILAYNLNKQALIETIARLRADHDKPVCVYTP